jgi:hypothetical protein
MQNVINSLKYQTFSKYFEKKNEYQFKIFMQIKCETHFHYYFI